MAHTAATSARPSSDGAATPSTTANFLPVPNMSRNSRFSLWSDFKVMAMYGPAVCILTAIFVGDLAAGKNDGFQGLLGRPSARTASRSVGDWAKRARCQACELCVLKSVPNDLAH